MPRGEICCEREGACVLRSRGRKKEGKGGEKQGTGKGPHLAWAWLMQGPGSSEIEGSPYQVQKKKEDRFPRSGVDN